MSEGLYILLFLVASTLGYKLIVKVPALLHTPLMSGMNALSGITVLGALSATAAAVLFEHRLAAFVAIVLAMVNVAGGFLVTDRMLRMFKSDSGPS